MAVSSLGGRGVPLSRSQGMMRRSAQGGDARAGMRRSAQREAQFQQLEHLQEDNARLRSPPAAPAPAPRADPPKPAAAADAQFEEGVPPLATPTATPGSWAPRGLARDGQQGPERVSWLGYSPAEPPGPRDGESPGVQWLGWDPRTETPDRRRARARGNSEAERRMAYQAFLGRRMAQEAEQAAELERDVARLAASSMLSSDHKRAGAVAQAMRPPPRKHFTRSRKSQSVTPPCSFFEPKVVQPIWLFSG